MVVVEVILAPSLILVLTLTVWFVSKVEMVEVGALMMMRRRRRRERKRRAMTPVLDEILTQVDMVSMWARLSIQL